MNKINVLTVIGVVISTLYLNASYAQSYGEYKKSIKHKIKCYVSVIDDRKALYFAPASSLNHNALANTLVGTQMYVPDLHAKRRIVEVYECVDFDREFSDDNAKKLEKDADF
ncbi:MAG: TapY2 family type IVa secretion system protein [Alteromonadaceae bacterium]|nr:TapY2 family type IVa secretion system protein [Alteromonadaceae bacterium]